MASELRPLVVLERMAAQIKHAVDASRPAEDAPLEPVQLAAIQGRNRLGFKIPVAPQGRARDERGAGDFGREPEPDAASIATRARFPMTGQVSGKCLSALNLFAETA